MRYIWLLSVAIVACVLDLSTKLWAQSALAQKTIATLPHEILRFELHFNSGIAFSLPVPSLIQIILTSVLVIGMVWYAFWRVQSFWQQYGLMLAVGGALGNLYERVLFQEVTDFIAVWQFPIFNIADSCICLGLGLFVAIEFCKKPIAKSQTSSW